MRDKMATDKPLDIFKESFKVLNSFRKSDLLCDIKLRGKMNGQIINAHKVILAAKSIFFKTMFTSGMKESSQDLVTLETIESDILKKIINYIYTGEIILLPSEIEDIVDASHMLGIDHIHEKCFLFLQNNIDISNCYGIAKLAEKYNYIEVSKLAESYAVKNFRSIAKTDEFLHVSFENFSNLLSTKNINVSKEEDIYKAIIRWVKHDAEKRKSHLKNLLSNVWFPGIERKFFIDTVMREDLILSNKECREYLLKALDYHLVPERRDPTCYKQVPHRVALTSALYVIGGENRTGALNSVEMFELSSQTWQRCSSLQTGRKHPSVVMLHGFIYCVGGVDNNSFELATVEKYDPSLNCWTTAPAMHKCKGGVAAAALDGWLYVAGGSENGSPIKYFERYDPATEEWSFVQPMKNPRSYFSMGVLNQKIYAIGGNCTLGESEHCEVFDPLNNKWEDIADLNKPRMNHGVTTTLDKIFAIGGQNNCGILDCIEKYNKGLNMWLVIKHTLDPRTGASINLVTSEENSDWIFIVGGIDGTHCYHSSVKTIDWQSLNYFLGSGKSMIEPRAFSGSCTM